MRHYWYCMADGQIKCRCREIRKKEKAVELCEPCRKELGTAEVEDFVKAVEKEAAYQREHWGAEHDAGKTEADWFWLIGYLGGKALHNPMAPGETRTERDLKLHRIITVAAAACNWHAAVQGKTNMRPGMDPAKIGLAPDA